MHKNINKIINAVLIGSFLGSNISVFAIEDSNSPLLEQFNSRNTLAETNAQNEVLNYEYIGPFTINKNLTLGSVPDVAVDLSLADEYSKYLVKKYLKPEGTLMLSDLVKVVGFDNGYFSYGGETALTTKTNYEWLRLLPNLEDVGINISSKVTSGVDISILSSLKKLTSISLYGEDEEDEEYANQLKNITKLYELESDITRLNLTDIKNMEFIDFSKVKGLVELSLDDVTFVDENQVFATFPNSTTLKVLSFWDFTNENYVPYFTNLEELYIHNLKKNINLNSLTNLISLSISGDFGHNGNINFDASMIKNLTNLKSLSLRPYTFIGIDNPTNIDSLTKLESLALYNINSGTNKINYNNLSLLSTLTLGNSDISSLSNTLNLTSLKTLNVYSSNITDLSDILNAKYKNSLEILSFGNKDTKLSNLSLIKGIPNLKEVSVFDINVENVDDLFSLAKIESIELYDITGLKEITINNTVAKSVYISSNTKGPLEKVNIKTDNNTIEKLSIRGNLISDISFLGKLKSLNNLNLPSNQISDASPVLSIYSQLKNKGLSIYNNFIPKEQMESLKGKFDFSDYSSYKLIKEPNIEEASLNINENSPANLIKFAAIQNVNSDYSFPAEGNGYKLEFILDDPRMGYVDSSFKLIPTKTGTITGTMNLYGDKTGNNSFKLSFNSTVAENKGSIKVVYIDADTKEEIKAPTYLTGLNAGDVTVKAETIAGYDLVGNESVVETIDSSNLDKTVTFEYKKQVKKTGTVTINFVDNKTGLKIREPLIITDIALSTFTYKAENIEGYTLVGDTSKTVAITSENLNHNMEFRYSKVEVEEEKVTGSIVVKYIDKDSKAEISKSETLSSLELKAHIVEAKTISGYKIVGENKVSVELTKESKNKEVVFTYTKENTSNGAVEEDKYDIVATKSDIESAISQKTGIDLVGDKTTISVNYKNLNQIKTELSELGLTIINDITNKEDVLNLAKTNNLNAVDCFGAISNIKDLSKAIDVIVIRDDVSSVTKKTFYLYKANEKTRSLDLEYLGSSTYESGKVLFNISSSELDGSSFVITTNKRASDGNGTTNNGTTDNTNADKDKDKDEDKNSTIPDTSGLALLVKALSVTGIAGAILLIKKKKK